MKNVQIPFKLFYTLLKHHLISDGDYTDEICKGLEQKLDSMVQRELYSKSKTAPTIEERETARKEYLDKKVYRTASGGIVLVDDNRQGRVTLLLISDKEERMILMIIQPEWGTRNVNEYFYESEARRIAILNEVFGDVELSRAEMQTLIWLAGWEEGTVKHVVSAVRKVMSK